MAHLSSPKVLKRQMRRLVRESSSVVSPFAVCLAQIDAVLQETLQIGHKKAPAQITLHVPGHRRLWGVGHMNLCPEEAYKDDRYK